MQRRRFLFAAASAAMAAPFAGIAGCGDSSNGEPAPVPPSDVVLSLPKDMYLHVGAPTEWWWHTGTLVAGDRKFGFEINAASFAQDGFAFTQVMLADVATQRHFERTTPYLPPVFDPNRWAQSDVSQDWYARLGDPEDRLAGFVAMDSPAADPIRDIRVRAALSDQKTLTPVTFDLTLSQEGRPFFVWGTGVNPDGPHTMDLDQNNFYFSLTRLHASGSIVVDGRAFDVSGVTWMDHEYGAFGTPANPVKWLLQDMQLDDGTCISNYVTIPDGSPALDQTVDSFATIQNARGDIWFVRSLMTPIGRTWTSPESGRTYFTQFRVEIPEFRASFEVTALVDAQEFFVPARSVYEGIAESVGTFRGRPVSGTAWIEQAL